MTSDCCPARCSYSYSQDRTHYQAGSAVKYAIPCHSIELQSHGLVKSWRIQPRIFFGRVALVLSHSPTAQDRGEALCSKRRVSPSELGETRPKGEISHINGPRNCHTIFPKHSSPQSWYVVLSRFVPHAWTIGVRICFHIFSAQFPVNRGHQAIDTA